MTEENESNGKDLRAQLEQALKDNKALKEQVEAASTAQRELAFRDVGIDTTKGVGKLLAERYDGELDTEAITAFAKEYDVDIEDAKPAATEQQVDPAQQRVDALQRESTLPGGAGQRLSANEYLDLTKTDPQAAIEARRNNLVDIPAHMEQNLDANRAVVRLGT